MSDTSEITDVQILWEEYKKTGDEELRNELVGRYLNQVKIIADRIKVKLPPSFELDDLIQAGVFGLFDAIDGFDLTRGVKFETFCSLRIKGAILDHLRSQDWVPRLVRSKASQIASTQHELETELGRAPTDYEMAEKLGVTLEEFDNLLQQATAASITSLSRTTDDNEENKSLRKIDILEDKKASNPISRLERKELMEYITRGLSQKERYIIILYYYEELTMKEIGIVLELSESRVCQIHSRIILRLKNQLAKIKHELL
ncbi:MAG: FliA/WhiG family RNA polymerase sigma factor [Planctomycetes bacterium]|nr:FliA/WhiG family RNA polymerase sigma factor [Planctomycetota bacterium]